MNDSTTIAAWAAKHGAHLNYNGANKEPRRGWRATTRIFLGTALVEGETVERVLTIETSKDSRGALSTCSSIGHSQEGFTTTRIFKDFIRWEKGDVTRVTEKAIRGQHAAETSPERLDAIVAAVTLHYLRLGEPLLTTRRPIPN